MRWFFGLHCRRKLHIPYNSKHVPWKSYIFFQINVKQLSSQISLNGNGMLPASFSSLLPGTIEHKSVRFSTILMCSTLTSVCFLSLLSCVLCRCIVKITGEMVLSFPAGITRHFANNPSPAALTFRVVNFSRLEHVLPNPQLLCW